MWRKNSILNRAIALVLSIIIVLALSLSFGSKVSASALDIEPEFDFTNKVLTNYIRPYAGLSVREAVCYYGKTVYPDSSTKNSYVYFNMITNGGFYDENDNRLNEYAQLENGKKYKYRAEFTSLSSDVKKYPPVDISNYKIKTIDAISGKEVNCKIIDSDSTSNGYYIMFEYEFKATEIPANNRGCYIVDFTEEKNTFSDENEYKIIDACLKQLYFNHSISAYSSHMELNCPDMIDFDKDNTSDICYDTDYKTFSKLSTISIKGEMEYDLPLDAKEYLNENYAHSSDVYYTSIKFIFDKYDINNAFFSGIEDKNYTGSEIKQSPIVKYNDITLVEGKDYTVSYSNNKEVGTATVTFTGIGKYTGTVNKTFKINQVNLPSTPVEKPKTDDIPEIKGTVHGDLASGLWVERPDGTYPVSQWGKVNGKLYYFDKRGYAAANEYADGKWFGADGVLDENYTMEWKSNDKGWWIEDKSGWYPVSRWLKIDGYWYYFLDSGYMDYSEYRDGCWLGSDGAWVEEYYGGHWCSNSSGWWYEDASGWYPTNLSLWIDGVYYTFGKDGYMK